MNLNYFVLTGLLILPLMAGCSTIDNAVDYENNVIAPSLEIPPDLITRSESKNLILPGSITSGNTDGMSKSKRLQSQ